MGSAGLRTTASSGFVMRCVAIALIASAVFVTGCSPRTAVAQPPHGADVAGSVLITGDVHNATTLSPEELRAFPPQTRAVAFDSSSGPQRHTYVGSLLVDIVNAAQPAVDSADQRAMLATAVIAIGADGYAATVAWGEISPAFAAEPVLVAHTEDGRDLDRPRLVVPGDLRGGRYVTDLTELRLVDLRG